MAATTTYSVYCDESSHLEHDGSKCMVLGAVWCPADRRHEINARIAELKIKHNLSRDYEIKWTKISKSKLDFYLDLIDYFFDDDDLHFRGLVAEKTALNHKAFGHDHNDWYYIMYFNLIKVILDNSNYYNIFLDIKDTIGGKKVDALHTVLSNQMYDFDRRVIKRIQLVRSHEVSILQIADVLSGALMARNREQPISAPKEVIINRIIHRSGYTLKRNTLAKEDKFNVFIWQSQREVL